MKKKISIIIPTYNEEESIPFLHEKLNQIMLEMRHYVTGDCAIFMDADLQDPPELIPQLVEYWEQAYDDVYARRRKRTGEGFVKKFTSKMYYKVLQKMTNVEIQRDTGNYRLIDRRCINALKKMTESERCLKSMFSWMGYNKKEVLQKVDMLYSMWKTT